MFKDLYIFSQETKFFNKHALILKNFPNLYINHHPLSGFLYDHIFIAKVLPRKDIQGFLKVSLLAI